MKLVIRTRDLFVFRSRGSLVATVEDAGIIGILTGGAAGHDLGDRLWIAGQGL